MVKPRIRKWDRVPGNWACHSDAMGFVAVGHGASPKEAYDSWREACRKGVQEWREKWVPPATLRRWDPPPLWGDNSAPKYLPPPWTVTC